MGGPCAFQFRHLIEECLRIEHHAVADHSRFRGPQHASRRQQRQLVGPYAMITSARPALAKRAQAYDDVGLLRQPVDSLAPRLFGGWAPTTTPNDGHFARKIPLQLSWRNRHELRARALFVTKEEESPTLPDHAPS